VSTSILTPDRNGSGWNGPESGLIDEHKYCNTSDAKSYLWIYATKMGYLDPKHKYNLRTTSDRSFATSKLINYKEGQVTVHLNRYW